MCMYGVSSSRKKVLFGLCKCFFLPSSIVGRGWGQNYTQLSIHGALISSNVLLHQRSWLILWWEGWLGWKVYSAPMTLKLSIFSRYSLLTLISKSGVTSFFHCGMNSEHCLETQNILNK